MNGFDLVRLQPNQVLKTGDTITGNLTATNNAKFVGNLTGNADTATRLQTARNIQVGNTTRAFNGTNNISFSLQDIGASEANHNHDNDYLKLSGGVMTGDILSNANRGVNLGGVNNRFGTVYTNILDLGNNTGIYTLGQYVLTLMCGHNRGGENGEIFYSHNGQAYHIEPKWSSNDVATFFSTGLGRNAKTFRDLWTHMGHTQVSDITKKENIKKIVSDKEVATISADKSDDYSNLSSEAVTEVVRNIQPITFDYKGMVTTDKDGTIAEDDEISKMARQLGISAQQLEQLNPTLFEYVGNKITTKNEDGDLETNYSIKTLAYTNMLLVALQETMKKVEALEKKSESLEKEVEELKTKI